MKTWNESIQARVGTISKALAGIKEVKMLGMTDLFLENLQSLRVEELEKSKKFRFWIVVMNVIGMYS